MKLNKRGKVVIALIVIITAYFLATSIWWVGNGWCIGSSVECLLNP